jgi:type VI secretion system (T6SS) effector TldE1-like protein
MPKSAPTSGNYGRVLFISNQKEKASPPIPKQTTVSASKVVQTYRPGLTRPTRRSNGERDMPWIYHQRSGLLEYRWQHAAHSVGTGYSGAPGAVNDPTQEAIHFRGPIPKGRYRVGTIFHHHEKGPHVMSLTPVGHSAHHRTDLLIHGDNDDLNHTASQGCVILAPEMRLRIGHSHDRTLEHFLFTPIRGTAFIQDCIEDCAIECKHLNRKRSRSY